MNMVDSNKLERDAGGKSRPAFPHPARAQTAARIGALFYAAWGLFHIRVAWDIYQLGTTQDGIAQGRTFQLAAYMLTISLFVVGIAILFNWRNDRRGYWLNLCVAGWADTIWVIVVVAPGYVGAARGLIPPAIFVIGAIATTIATLRNR